MICRFLTEDDFAGLHRAFLAAFSDYLTPFQPSETQFRLHILNNGVDLSRSAGCFAKGEMAGFTLNGFGTWNEKATLYDAGTGVIPLFRRRGVGRAMFDFMLPAFRESGIEQCLLEVITGNEKAVKLYEALGFEHTRKLLVLRAEEKLNFSREPWSGIEIRPVEVSDWNLFRSFWDGKPSWQNSPEAVERTRNQKNISGAFIDGRCVGYIIFPIDSGNITQLAVDKSYRNRSIGSLLLNHMQNAVGHEKSLQAVNVDESLTETILFLRARGFAENLSQYEMIKTL
jgi:ribosomal protein S18 acetylase RimI-like enzyme